MAKSNDYFALLTTQASYCVKAADFLEEFLSSYSADTLSSHQEQLHAIEHQADEVQHDIMTRLTSEFITPIEQEDITHLVQLIDDVTDALDDILLECYMYHVSVLPDGAMTLFRSVRDCVRTLYDAVGELKSFKKPTHLRTLLVEVNSIETEADTAYNEGVHHLFSQPRDVRELLGGKAILDSMEGCCDLCEHAADVIDQIIMKNA